jgi:hypothetical protein
MFRSCMLVRVMVDSGNLELFLRRRFTSEIYKKQPTTPVLFDRLMSREDNTSCDP